MKIFDSKEDVTSARSSLRLAEIGGTDFRMSSCSSNLRISPDIVDKLSEHIVEFKGLMFDFNISQTDPLNVISKDSELDLASRDLIQFLSMMRRDGPINANRYNEGQIILADDQITERTLMKRRMKEMG